MRGYFFSVASEVEAHSDLPIAAMSDPLQLSEMLNEHWITAIGDLVRKQPNVEKFLGLKRDAATIPERSLTFTSLNQLHPKDINVVIFGTSNGRFLHFQLQRLSFTDLHASPFQAKTLILEPRARLVLHSTMEPFIKYV